MTSAPRYYVVRRARGFAVVDATTGAVIGTYLARVDAVLAALSSSRGPESATTWRCSSPPAPWDLRGAAARGYRTAYIARPGAVRPAADDRFDLEAADLHALADQLA